MMRGAVNAQREAGVVLRLRGPGGAESDVSWIIDTGYTGSLTLPSATVAALGLLRQPGGTAVLADGTSRAFDVYAVGYNLFSRVAPKDMSRWFR